MDRTETYIKMSDCPEIQDIFKGFDLAQFPNFVYDKVTERVSIIFWTPTRLRRTVNNKGNVLVVSIESDRDKNQYVPEYDGDFCDSVIWLPLQDQLQEMVGADTYGWLSIDNVDRLEFFYEFVHSGNLKDHGRECSMEQLWLAFYMAVKHGKYWTDEGWKSREATPD